MPQNSMTSFMDDPCADWDIASCTGHGHTVVKYFLTYGGRGKITANSSF